MRKDNVQNLKTEKTMSLEVNSHLAELLMVIL